MGTDEPNSVERVLLSILDGLEIADDDLKHETHVALNSAFNAGYSAREDLFTEERVLLLARNERLHARVHEMEMLRAELVATRKQIIPLRVRIETAEMTADAMLSHANERALESHNLRLQLAEARAQRETDAAAIADRDKTIDALDDEATRLKEWAERLQDQLRGALACLSDVAADAMLAAPVRSRARELIDSYGAKTAPAPDTITGPSGTSAAGDLLLLPARAP